VFFIAFTTSSPIGDSFDMRWEVIICSADDKGRARVIDGIEDSCQDDSLASLTCVIFQVGYKIA